MAQSQKHDMAYKKLGEYAQRNNINTECLIYGGGILTRSGAGGRPRITAVPIRAWNEMIVRHKVKRAENRAPHVCAEANLWLTLVNKHKTPKNIDAWVVSVTRKSQVRQAIPCRNCRQWSRKEFKSMNSR